ncbi:hypothetical protein HDV05_005132 [Chytridiales sp. JEL 0842]|nr:hypothetical protein HDV05_005132 [Chytridiales sp. JEL 0842]
MMSPQPLHRKKTGPTINITQSTALSSSPLANTSPTADDDEHLLMSPLNDRFSEEFDESKDEYGPTTVHPLGPKPPIMSMWKMVTLNAFWFGYHLYFFLLTIVIVPKQIEEIVGNDNKGNGLSYVSLLAGLINMFTGVVFGALNDRYTSPYGKRRIWILTGGILMSISLFFLSSKLSLHTYALVYLILTTSSVVASVPFNGLLGDVTHPDQKGGVSAIMGFCMLGGYLLGAVVGAVVDISGGPNGITKLYIIMVTAVLSTMFLTLLTTPESTSTTVSLASQAPIVWKEFLWNLVKPLYQHRDFRLVFISRFVYQLGIATVQQFLQYWIIDCVSTTFPSTQAVSLALIPLLLLSPVGYGPFISTEFAMLMDVLPSTSDAGKDMALWHSALLLPQIVATPVAGWLLDSFQQVGEKDGVQCLGYKVVFVICMLYFISGAEVTRRIHGVK